MDRYGISIGKTPPPKKSVESKEPKNPKGKLSDSEKEALLANLLQTAQGRARLAASFSNPLRQRMDYSSIARRVFNVDPLPQGAIPLYDINADQESYSIDETGQRVISTPRILGRGIEIPLFEIASNPQISLEAVRERRFELLDQVQEEAIRTMGGLEEGNAFSLLDMSGSGHTVHGDITTSNLIEIINLIERNDLVTRRLFMNILEYRELRRTESFRSSFDVVTHQALLESGLNGTIFGSDIIVSRAVPAGMIFATAEPQFTGVIPVRTDITTLSADDPVNRRIGFSIFENIGMSCVNTGSVAVLNSNPPEVVESQKIQKVEPIVVPRMNRYELLLNK
jgi:hypothetical protein